jgi:hypothetical protein
VSAAVQCDRCGKYAATTSRDLFHFVTPEGWFQVSVRRGSRTSYNVDGDGAFGEFCSLACASDWVSTIVLPKDASA